MGLSTKLTRRLEHSRALPFVAVSAAFSAYFCMYAFRKPFAAASYEGAELWGTEVTLKSAFVVSQVLGYTLSKFVGIKVCSEAKRDRRGLWLIGLIAAAELTLLLFGALPPKLKVFAMFANGLPLGMIWGLVVSYLEGRRTSELLLAGLSCSFIVASGVVKDVGRFVMHQWSVPEYWMPALVGGMFLLPFALSVFWLERLPRPSIRDEEERSRRTPMRAAERWHFIRTFAPGLLLLFTSYFFLTAFRDFRDNFGVEIFRELGYASEPALFTKTEVPVAIAIMALLACLSFLRSNRWALIAVFALMTCGLLALGGAGFLRRAGLIDGTTYMFAVGLGAYATYVPFGSVLFDRLIAHTRVAGTAVFAIYVADALGYCGSIAVQLYADLVGAQTFSRLEFFDAFATSLALGGGMAMALSGLYFVYRPHRVQAPATAPR